MALAINGVGRRFRNGKGFGPFTCEISNATRWVGIHGPNGSGKSTFLKVLAGVEQPDSGTVAIDEVSWLDQPIGPERGVLVWQGRTMFPDLTAGQNVEFAWRKDRVPVKLRDEYARAFKLDHRALLAQKASTLSGGEAQRVAILRALLTGPRLLLLDEPFGQQDARTKKDLVSCFHALRSDMQGADRQASFPEWVFLVSHDEDELLSLVDTVLVFDDAGKLVSRGSPRDLLDSPKSAAAADLIGIINRLSFRLSPEAKIVLAGTEQHGSLPGNHANGLFVSFRPGTSYTALLPAAYLYPEPETGAPDGVLYVVARIQRVIRRIAGYEVVAVTPTGEMAISFLSIREYETRRVEVGEHIRFCLDPKHLFVQN